MDLAHLKQSINEVHGIYFPSAKHLIAYIECPLQHEENRSPHIRTFHWMILVTQKMCIAVKVMVKLFHLKHT